MGKRFIFLIIVYYTSAFLLLAQNVFNDTITIDEVVVSGYKPPLKDRSIIPMQTLTHKELENIAGQSLADAVKNFTGVFIKDYGGIGGLKTVMVRSLGSNHTAVFMDGVQFSDASTGQVDLGKISLDQTEEVNLIIGQPINTLQPARYFASASVININSFTSPKQQPLSVKAQFKKGSFGLFNANISLQNKISHTFTDLFCHYTHANGNYPFLLQYGSNNYSTERRSNSDINALNIQANTLINLPNKAHVSIKLYYYSSERGLPGAVIYYNPFAQQRLWNEDFFTNVQYQSRIDKKITYLTNIKFSQNFLKYFDPAYLNTDGKLENTYLQREYYVSQAINIKIRDSLQFSIATDCFMNSLNTNLYEHPTPTRYSSLTAASLLFTKARWEAFGNILNTYVHEKTLRGEPAPDRWVITPTFSTGYLLFKNPNLKIRFLYKNIFRLPTFNDLYFTLIGNNQLKPEYAHQYNLGFTLYSLSIPMINYLSFKAEGFYNKVTDKIIAIPTKNLFVWSMRNIGKVDIKGLELQGFVQFSMFKNIKNSLSINYTYQEALDVTNPLSASYKQQIPYLPFETLSSMITINYKKLTLNYNVLYNGYRYFLEENVYENMLPGWWVSDVSLSYYQSLKKIVFKIKGEVSNLFNRQY